MEAQARLHVATPLSPQLNPKVRRAALGEGVAHCDGIGREAGSGSGGAPGS